MKNKSALLTEHQASAEITQARETIERACQKYHMRTVQSAIAILDSGQLHRAQNTKEHAQWLLGLKQKITKATKQQKTNIIWEAVASAPVGFRSVSSGMLGFLLDLVDSGEVVSEIVQKFNEKMDPAKYMRVTAPAKKGNIDQAEKAFTKMGLENSLDMRAARLSDLGCIWASRAVNPTARGGMFDSLRTMESTTKRPINPQVTSITFSKFRRTVLPEALRITYRVTSAPDNYSSFAVQSNAKAKPIFHYDRPDRGEPTPASMYTYVNPTSHTVWGLRVGEVDVTGIVLRPDAWYGRESGIDEDKLAAIFILEGARDGHNPYVPIFPETLRSELHQFRQTIENFARTKRLTGVSASNASGIMFTGRKERVFTVYTKNGTRMYRIDRWD